MAELVWPSDIIPSSSEWRIIDSTAVFNSALSGVTRTVSRPGLRMACTLNFMGLSGEHRSRVQAIISALRGRTNRIWLTDDSNARRGSFPATEVITNTTFADTTGWTSSNAEMVLTADSGRLRLARTGVTADRTAATGALTTTTSTRYLFRVNATAGRGNINFRLQAGTTSAGTDRGTSAAITANGLQYITVLATTTTTFLSILDYISGRAANDFQLIDGLSFARCALVNGASQTGSSLWIDNLPSSTVGLLKAGDMVAIYTNQWEMKRLTADLNSNSSAEGQLLFEPPLRSSPADNAAVAIHRPMARFLLADEEVAWSSRPGVLSDFSLSFVEDLT